MLLEIVEHLKGLQCTLENCRLSCDNITACTAAEALMLLGYSFCNKNALSTTQRPKNLAYVAKGIKCFKGIKVDISLYHGK